MRKKRAKKSPKEKGDIWVSKRELQSVSKRLKRQALDLPVTKEVKTVESATPMIVPGDLLKEMTLAIKSGDTDPLVREMTKYALGDVVGLGLMSQAQFDEVEEFDEEGIVIRESGRAKALEMIPTSVRAKMLAEIAPYFLAKKTSTLQSPGEKARKVIFKVPDNGRPTRGDE